jgi:hypothetical protein
LEQVFFVATDVRTASMVGVANEPVTGADGRWWVNRCSPWTTRL